MLRNLILSACLVAMPAGAAEPQRLPVLVELFTSEGCSSCPPADRLLQLLDAQTIVLSEHVDYWDHDGWKDPSSSHAFTVRQESYAHAFGLSGAYTPEMVVDGAAEFVGNDSRTAEAVINKAFRQPKIELHLTRTATGLRVEMAGAPNAADVMLALAEDSVQSQVAAGENKGLSLRHIAVVRSLRKIGSAKRGTLFQMEMELPAGARAQRIVVFAQEPGPARVTAAAMLPPIAPLRKPESPLR